MNKNIIFWAAVSITIFLGCFGSSYAEEVKKNTQAPSADSTLIQKVTIARLPKLIDLGSESCIPCKKMAPILEDLKIKYKGKAEVIFIDVKEDRAASLKHKITLIPTQIFFDTSGVEVYRHIGFFPADSIMAHFKELGATL